MRNSELESRTLFAETCEKHQRSVVKLVLLCVTLGCHGGADAPQVVTAVEPKASALPLAVLPSPLPARPKPPSVMGRPPNMPCWIIKKDALPSGEFDGRATIYELSYGQEGRLEAATQWPMKPYCVGEGEDNCVELHGDPEPSLQYHYDDAGHLIEVSAARAEGHTARMSVNYDAAGRVASYAWTEQTPKEPVSRRETTIAFNAAGDPIGEITKGQSFKKKWRQSLAFARLEGNKGAKTAIVWPDSPATLYLGWTYKADIAKVEGFGVAEGDEIVRIDDAGRIRNRTVSFRGKLQSVRVFSYECPREGEFKRIPWKTWVPSDASDLLGAGRNGLSR